MMAVPNLHPKLPVLFCGSEAWKQGDTVATCLTFHGHENHCYHNVDVSSIFVPALWLTVPVLPLCFPASVLIS